MLRVGMSVKAGVLLGLRPEIDWGRAGSPVPRYCPSHVIARPTLWPVPRYCSPARLELLSF